MTTPPNSPDPPPRAARLYWEKEGATREVAVMTILSRLTSIASLTDRWRCDAGVVQLRLLDEDETTALAVFESPWGEGRIEIATHPGEWLGADIYIADRLVTRAWVEQSEDDIEFWPDGDDGAGDPRGRLDKAGVALSLIAWPTWRGPLTFEAIED